MAWKIIYQADGFGNGNRKKDFLPGMLFQVKEIWSWRRCRKTLDAAWYVKVDSIS